ncbi:MAG: phosphate acyltransferase [Clostridiales bacterium]|nr:phosphate acyltransferase [Clostridiales bacterium]
MAELKNFQELRSMVLKRPRKIVAVSCANDWHTLEAVFKAKSDGLLDYVLIGDKNIIKEICREKHQNFPEGDIIHCTDEKKSAEITVSLVREGKADFLQKGLMQTRTILKAVLDKKTGIGTGNLMSNVALLEIPGYHKLVGVTDGGMIIYPTFEQKVGMIKNAVRMFNYMGYEKPKVAVTCALEIVNPKMQETVDAAKLKEMAENGGIDNCFVEGPISTDIAFSKDAAKVKKFESPVAGDADIILVPNINAGNMMVKGLLLFGHAKMAGVVMGAKCPIALNSRSASFEEKYFALVACCLISDLVG